jgi:hypothetical protein
MDHPSKRRRVLESNLSRRAGNPSPLRLFGSTSRLSMRVAMDTQCLEDSSMPKENKPPLKKCSTLLRSFASSS